MKIEVETTQNVSIEYELANIGDRIIAALLDYLIIIGYFIAIVVFTSILQPAAELSYSITFWVIIIFPVFFYDLLCEIFLQGQSFGKKIKKIKVIKIDGSQPTFISYFLRWILRTVDITFTYGSVAIITIFINGKGQRLGDIAAGTTVIKLKPDIGFRDTIFTEVSDNYTPQFPQVVTLSDKDIGLIKEVMNQLPKVPNIEIYNKILVKTVQVISEKIGVQPPLMNYLTFLQVIIKDYNYLNNK